MPKTKKRKKNNNIKNQTHKEGIFNFNEQVDIQNNKKKA